MRAILALSLTTAIAGSLPAQIANFLGFAAGFNTSYTDRGNANATNADVLNVFSTRDYRHWCLDNTNPLGNTKRFVGFRFVVQDQIGNTPENYTLVGYKDDPLAPGNPDVNPAGTGVWFRTGTLTTPLTSATGAFVHTITLGINPPAIPMNFGTSHGPTDDNLYLGIGLVAGNWPTDGLGIHMAFDFNAGNTGTNALDVVGPRILTRLVAPQSNYVCTVATSGIPNPLPTGQVPSYPGTIGTRGGYRQMNLEILALTTGGVTVTQTNQIRYSSSNPLATPSTTAAVPLGGTTNMLSGLHPDVNDASATVPPPAGAPARADDIGFLITERNRPNSLVIVRLAFGPLVGGFNPDGSLPIQFIPGFNAATSTGNVCVDLADPSAFTLINFTDANGRCQQMFNLGPAGSPARLFLQSYGALDLHWQGFVTNLAVNPSEVKATGCAVVHL